MPSDSQLSQFRRPWSPGPFETIKPITSSSRNRDADINPIDDHLRFASQLHQHESSDASVEALDLADYSRTLYTRPKDAVLEHSIYPLHSRLSRNSFPSNDTLQPPLLSSEGPGTSTAHLTSSRSHRPFSLPPFSRFSESSSRYRSNSPYGPEHRIRSQDSEIDISHFPAWSKNWYNTDSSILIPASPPDIYTPLPKSHLTHPVQRSPFDPGRIYPDLDDLPAERYGFPPTSSLGHDSTRELLPWSPHPLDDVPIDSSLKEERLRMLEREFGPNAKGKGRVESDHGLDENRKPLIGTVDSKGYLVTQGPKKRTAIRILQLLLSLAAAGPSIYAALFIKPTETPPPAGKAPAFVLYILSVLTFLLLLYLFVLRPCCCMKRPSKGVNTPFSNGMMVLPVQGLPGGKKGKNKGGKKGQVVHGGDVQVNLIVDPEVFGTREGEYYEEEDNEDQNASIPGGHSSTAGSKWRRHSRAPRRSVFAGLAMEEDWKKARSWTMKVTFIDVASLLVWGAAFIFIMIGQRCPSGGFSGWCNAYNVSSAAACLLSVAFGVSTFFNVKDLNDSKVSPRTRT